MNVVRHGERPAPPFETEIRMRWASLRILSGSASWNTGDEEVVALPLEGSWRVGPFDLHGRADVFAGMSDACYLPPATPVEFDGVGRLAVLGAAARSGRAARYLAVDELPVVARGSGMSSRQVVDFASAGHLDAERLLGCEGYIPSGNWSSYPPHKHDTASGTESVLEEIYYFVAAEDGYGIHRVSSSPAGEIEVLAEVRSGDAVLVPYGWHGPTIAPPDNAVYYLNVMAGPRREWLTTDHPGNRIRSTWSVDDYDPRLPLVVPPSGAIDATRMTRAI